MNKQQGFTLIELMIVVAIIAILAAIALPQYQNYVAKSQFTAAMAESGAGKTAFEEAINDGRGASITSAAQIGLATSKRCGTYAVAYAAASSTITCTMLGSPKINSQTVVWTRSSAGTWACSSAVDAKFKPATCQ